MTYTEILKALERAIPTPYALYVCGFKNAAEVHDAAVKLSIHKHVMELDDVEEWFSKRFKRPLESFLVNPKKGTEA